MLCRGLGDLSFSYLHFLWCAGWLMTITNGLFSAADEPRRAELLGMPFEETLAG